MRECVDHKKCAIQRESARMRESARAYATGESARACMRERARACARAGSACIFDQQTIFTRSPAYERECAGVRARERESLRDCWPVFLCVVQTITQPTCTPWGSLHKMCRGRSPFLSCTRTAGEEGCAAIIRSHKDMIPFRTSPSLSSFVVPYVPPVFPTPY